MAATPVTSKLWKFVLLTRNSAYFPALVQGAAAASGKPYSDTLLAKVASTPGVLDAITVTVEAGVTSPVDAEIERLITGPTTGPQVDAAVMAAVQSYTPPAA